MNLLIIGFTLQTLGEILVAFTALAVHHRVWKEHKIDKKVFKSMKREQVLGFLAILFLVMGFFLQLQGKI